MDRHRDHPGGPSRGRTIWRGFWLIAVAAIVLFHLVGGWYYAGVFERDALRVQPWEPAEDVEVTVASAETLTLRAVDGGDSTLDRVGTFGFRYADGYAQLLDVVPGTDGDVTRRFRLIAGGSPVVGTRGDVESFAYPDPVAAGVAATPVEFTTPLGPMGAWEIAGTRPEWVIHVHGKGAPRAEALRLVRALAPAGYHQLVVDYRNDPGEPLDPSGRYQYGRTEWEDLAGAVEYATANGAGSVVLVGYSTGAAVVLSYIYKTHDGAVSAAVLDSPNIDMSGTIDYGASQRDLAFGIPLPATLAGTTKFVAGLRYGINWQAIDYVRRSGQLVVPTLVIHGTDDRSVPIEISRRLAERRPQMVDLMEVSGAGHVESWNVDPAAYERRVIDFLSDTAA